MTARRDPYGITDEEINRMQLAFAAVQYELSQHALRCAHTALEQIRARDCNAKQNQKFWAQDGVGHIALEKVKFLTTTPRSNLPPVTPNGPKATQARDHNQDDQG